MTSEIPRSEVEAVRDKVWNLAQDSHAKAVTHARRYTQADHQIACEQVARRSAYTRAAQLLQGILSPDERSR